MFFKKLICISLVLFPLSTIPSAMQRDASSASLSEWVNVQSASTEPEAGLAVAAPLTPRAQTATPDFVRVTPTEQVQSPKPVLSPLHIPAPKTNFLIAAPVANEAPITPPNKPHETVSKNSPSPLSIQNSSGQLAASGTMPQNFLTTPAPAITPLSTSINLPQIVPVEALPPITPSCSVSPNALTNTVVAATVLAHAMVHAATQSTAPAMLQLVQAPAPIIQPLATLSEQQRSAAAAVLHNNFSVPVVAQYPMQRPSTIRQKSGSTGDLSIAIAPAVPSKKQEDEPEKQQSTCCMPITCCGKQIISGNVPSCPCPIQGCVIL